MNFGQTAERFQCKAQGKNSMLFLCPLVLLPSVFIRKEGSGLESRRKFLVQCAGDLFSAFFTPSPPPGVYKQGLSVRRSRNVSPRHPPSFSPSPSAGIKIFAHSFVFFCGSPPHQGGSIGLWIQCPRTAVGRECCLWWSSALASLPTG